jgi:hypothetical protein
MGEKAVIRRPPMVTSGVWLAAVLTLALWAWWPADDRVVDGTGVKASAAPGPSAGSSASLDRRTPATPTAASPVSLMAPLYATASFAVPITVAAAQQKLRVGEMNDLIVGFGANADVNEISFTVQFDPNVLQARAGTEGGWTEGAGPNARFAAEISDAGDRVQIRSAVPGQRVAIAGGSVAIVQFQAVAPGTTWVLITDVVVKDAAGRWIASAVPASNLQMTVDSPPLPQSDAWHQRGALAVEPPTETTENGD